MVCFLILLALAGAHAGAKGPSSLDKDAVRTLTGGSLEDQQRLAKQLARSGEAPEAFAMLLEAISILEEQWQQAAGSRDAQSRKLFAVYKRYYGNETSASPPSRIAEQYQALKDQSKELNAALGDREAALEHFIDAGRRLCSETDEELAAKGIGEAVKEALGKADASCHSRILDAVTGIPALALGPTLVELTLDDGHEAGRDPRISALRCMTRVPDATWIDGVSSLVNDADPYVRRALYDLAAAVETAPAVDLLLSQLDKETGVPAREIVDHLVHLTGRTDLGTTAARWRDWWQGVRSNWSSRRSRRAVGSRPRADWRYFGLDLDSKRVIFVVDTSLSMERGVQYRQIVPGVATPPDLGEIKRDIAERELNKAIDSLAEDATFNVIIYKTTFLALSDELLPATASNREKAKSWFRKQKPSGNTNISGPLLEAIAMTRPGRRPEDTRIADTIVFMSDGLPTCGPIKYEEDILAEIERLNRYGQIVVHTVHLGLEGKSSFMEDLARATGGQFVHHR
jgi:hypothetical protein